MGSRPLLRAAMSVVAAAGFLASVVHLNAVGEQNAATRAASAPTETPEPTSTPEPTDSDPAPTVALTFDDGPGADTAAILETLRSHDQVATFFVVGAHLSGRQDQVRALVDSGMSVQWHSRSHSDLTQLSDQNLVRELDPAPLRELGAEVACVRPPYGAVNDRVEEAAASLGLATVTWDIDTLDWQSPDPADIVAAVMDNLEPGDIVLMHDGGGDRSATSTALPTLLDRLAEGGWQTVTLC